MSQTRKKRKTYISSIGGGLRKAILLWFSQHLQALRFSAQQYIRAPASNLLITTVVGVVVLFPVGFYVIIENVQSIPVRWHDTAQFTAFLQPDVELEEAQSLAVSLQQDAAIVAVRLIDKDAALAEYRHLSGFAEVIDSLDENPLPHALLITPSLSQQDAEQQNILLNKLRQLEQVEHAQHDLQWVMRLFLLFDIIERAVLLLSALLLVTVLLIIGNTIRLLIYNRKQEIEIAKLFGATDAFIRRPFLYCGLWHGSLGMVVTWFLLILSLQFLAPPINKLAALYNSQFQLIHLSFYHFLILLSIGASLGLAGAWISFRCYINT